MTAGGGQDWRGGRTPRNAGQQNEPAPSWKQSRHSMPVKGGRLRFRMRMIAVSIFLIGLVAAVVALMQPAREYRTHIVQMNLTEDFEAEQGVLPSDSLLQKTGYRKVTVSRSETLSLPTSEADLNHLKKAHVVVIALQATFLPDNDDQFNCLIRISPPDLGHSKEYINLDMLKKQLLELQNQQPETPVLLLVDSPPVRGDWRTACLPATLSHEFEQWVSDLKRLVVVLACGEQGRSEPGASGTEQRTVFGHFASIGMSSLADQDSDREVSAAEYCSYVQNHTDDWVRTHRNPAGQDVQIFPALDSLKRSRNFKLIADPVVLPNSIEEIGGSASVDFAGLEKLWNLRQRLGERGGDNWNPIQWRSATEKLLRAEKFFLHGRQKNATDELALAAESLKALESLTNRCCPPGAAFIPERGLVMNDFDGLPSLGRVKPLFNSESEELTEDVKVPTPAEDVISSHMRSFPFSQAGLPVPSEEVVNEVRVRRESAELAVAQLMGVSQRIAATARHLEDDLLLSEDRQFVRPVESNEASPRTSADDMIQAINEFSQVYDRSERTLAELLDTGPSLAFWSARAGRDLTAVQRDIWTKILRLNSFELQVEMKAGDEKLSSLFDPLQSLSIDTAEKALDHERRAEELRNQSFRLLVHARGLQRSLDFQEPADGFRVENLRMLTDKLRSWEKAASMSLKRGVELSEQMCKSAAESSPAERHGQVQLYDFLQKSLTLTVQRPEIRRSILEALQKLDQKFTAAANSSSPSADGEKTAKSVNIANAEKRDAPGQAVDNPGSNVAYEASWLLQILNLLPSTETGTITLQDAWEAASEAGAEGVSERHDALARFGNSVRETWEMNRDAVKTAVQDTSGGARDVLRLADQRTRLFYGLDAQGQSLESPTLRFRRLKRIQYCLMQAERVVAGLWTEHQDVRPWAQSGWYSRVGVLWLKAASDIHEGVDHGASGPFPFVGEGISSLKARLSASEDLHLEAVPLTHDLNLGELDHGTFALQIKQVVAGQFSGEASLLARLADQSPVTITNNGVSLPLAGDILKTQLSVHRTGAPGRDACQPVVLNPEVFFRGRYWKSEAIMAVNPCAPAEFVVEKRVRNQTGRISVAGSESRPVVLILDFSDSMNQLLTGQASPRYLEALATLERLIKSNEVTGCRVILNVYGHRTQFVNGQHNPNPNYVKCFQKEIPPALRADNDIETEFDQKIVTDNDRLDFQKVLDKLKCSGPWGTTPLTKAVADAITVTLRGKAGIVIAVTDGEAKDFEGKPLADLRRAVGNHSSTSVRIVAFDLNSVPEQREKLQSTFGQFDTIKIVNASENEQLLKEIYASLDPREFTASWDGRSEPQTAPLGSSIEIVAPAIVSTLQFDKIVLTQPIVLNRGDVLTADLDHTGRRFLFRRAKRPVMQTAAEKPPSNDSPTLLRAIDAVGLSDVPATENSGMKKAELNVMLDHSREDLPVRQPAEFEFQVRPAGAGSGFRPPEIIQTFDAGSGAPGWRISISEWPADQFFLMDAAWKMDTTPPEKVIRWTELNEHTSIDTAILQGGSGLPDHSVWVTLRRNELQVRLDPVLPEPRPDRQETLGDRLSRNLVEDIRIEIGQRDTSDQDASFLAWEINTRIVRLESGSVRYEFSGDRISPESLVNAEIALTSASARLNGAMKVSGLTIE